MKIMQCDKCGKQRNRSDDLPWSVMAMRQFVKGGSEVICDLCPECHEQVMDFIGIKEVAPQRPQRPRGSGIPTKTCADEKCKGRSWHWTGKEDHRKVCEYCKKPLVNVIVYTGEKDSKECGRTW